MFFFEDFVSTLLIFEGVCVKYTVALSFISMAEVTTMTQRLGLRSPILPSQGITILFVLFLAKCDEEEGGQLSVS